MPSTAWRESDEHRAGLCQENVFSRPQAGTLHGKPAPRLELTGFLETGQAQPGWAMALSGPRDLNVIMTFVTNSCSDRR